MCKINNSNEQELLKENNSLTEALIIAIKNNIFIPNANLIGLNFSKENLSGINLSRVYLNSVNFSGANLSNANLSGSDITCANLMGADLSNANLSGANLNGANLREANLSNANLNSAYLSGADLSGANINNADLYSADLHEANFTKSNLCFSNMNKANLDNTDFSNANLFGANLSNSNIRDTDFNNAKLYNANINNINISNAKNMPYIPMCLPEGEFIGWEKLHNGLIVKLKILEDSKRSRATGDKCRCDKALVLEFQNSDGSKSDLKTYTNNSYAECTYTVGKMVKADSWDENRWNECSHGIHFFIDRQRAVDY